MAVTVFSSTGCIRCDIVKNYLKTQDIAYVEHDIKTEKGDETFKQFYRENRKNIRRDSKGIFFPVVLLDDGTIVQDAGSTLSKIITEGRLDSMIEPNQLGHGWTGGITLSAGSGEDSDDFLRILDIMKNGGLAVEAKTTGANYQILANALEAKLIDRLIFSIPWQNESRDGNQGEELKNSLRVAAAASNSVDVEYLTEIEAETMPQHVGETARFINESTQANNLPYKLFCSQKDAPNLFPYRTAARRWQVLTDIKK